MVNLFAGIQYFAVVIPVFLLALTIHEFAHAWLANRLGDPTARLQGRLTLNPLAHLDPIGMLAIIVIRFGWAKPVPVDARYLKNPRRDMVLIAAAGPASNLLLAAASAFCYRMIPWGGAGLEWTWLVHPMRSMFAEAVWINVVLAVFNLLPVPPLDGSRIVSGLLPLRQAISYSRLEPYGFIIIFLLFFSGLFRPVYDIMHVVSQALVLMWG